MTNFDKLHPSMQTALRDWLMHAMPATASMLDRGVMMPSGYLMTIDEVAMHMSSAAQAVLEQACSAAGLDGR